MQTFVAFIAPKSHNRFVEGTEVFPYHERNPEKRERMTLDTFNALKACRTPAFNAIGKSKENPEEEMVCHLQFLNEFEIQKTTSPSPSMDTLKIDGNTLIQAGFAPGPKFKDMLARSRELAAFFEPGNSFDKIAEILREEFPPDPPKLKMDDNRAKLNLAIVAETDEEAANVETVIKKMNELLLNPVITAGAVMPDACPAGSEPATIPVGGAIAVHNAIIPASHSEDACCSMFASFFESDENPSTELDHLLAVTRFGPGGRGANDLVHHPVLEENVWHNPFLKGLKHYAEIHMADQGDGNHFAFLGKIQFTTENLHALREMGHSELADQFKTDRPYRVLVTHHGSRGLGAKVYRRGLATAIEQTDRIAENVPKNAAWIEASSPAGISYWEALQYVGRWTRANHESIHNRFLNACGKSATASFGNAHNFVWKRGDMFYHGKGATPAWNDETGRPLLGLIPLNMGEPILLVAGKNNEKFLGFAPHGAGRNLSRTALKAKIGDEEAQAQAIADHTKHIDVRWYSGKADLSETPVAYKNAAAVRAQIEQFELADVLGEIHPLGCIMAGEGDEPAWKKARAEKLEAKND